MATRAWFFNLATAFLAVLSLNSFVLGQGDPNQVEYVTTEMFMLPALENIATYRLTLEGADNYYFEREFPGDAVPFIDPFGIHGEILPDGIYAFEMTLVPKIPEEAKEAIRLAHATGDMSGVEQLRKSGQIPAALEPVFGHFAIKEGLILFPGGEERFMAAEEVMDRGSMTDAEVSKRDQVISEDLIVDGSACIGVDCTDGEVFGYTTLLLKENNLVIKFDDTSTGDYPKNDWQLRANSPNIFGTNQFVIDDLTHSTTPFVVKAGAKTGALYVDNQNKVGFGTLSPRANLHIKTGMSPEMLFEVDGSQGFSPFRWSLKGDSTEFSLGDGARSPFRVFASAEQNSLVVGQTGNIGIGHLDPEVKLDLRGDHNATIRTRSNYAVPQFHAQFTGTERQRREMLVLENRGEPTIRLSNTDPASADDWSMVLLESDSFLISRNGSGANEMQIFNGGNVSIAGTLTESSDVNLKENFETVDALEVLDRVADLPITTWNYIRDNDSVRHMGPMAQDFAAAFGLGNTNVGISNVDSTGVMFAAIKGLNQRLDEKETDLNNKDEAILYLKKEQTELAQRLNTLQIWQNAQFKALAQDQETKLKALEDMIQKINHRPN